jgi:propanediol utilization protein
MNAGTIPIAVSVRHAHLKQSTLEALFGRGHVLEPRTPLSQPGQFAAVETVTLVGPRGRIEHVRVIGPPRDADQIELSRSDEISHSGSMLRCGSREISSARRASTSLDQRAR